ncbi:MAG: NAD(P)-binding domain-containing protein, partial [Neobacillus sp.]
MNKIAIVGAGSMAEAFISGIVENDLIDKKNIWVTNNSNEERLSSIRERYGVKSTYDLNKLFEGADIVVLAMKPKDAASAITQVREHLTEH